ncbi:MAG: D-2-hydroxyacid dehydrogenase [Pseudomonadota bacterium]
MKILVLDEFAEHYEPLLAGTDASVTFASDPAAVAESADILLAQPDFAADYLARGLETNWIQSTWAGVTPLVRIARERGVLVTGLKGIFGPLIAEYVFAHILADAGRLGDFARSQATGRWQPVWPGTIHGKRMAIVGTGSIGVHVAGVARHFGMLTRGISRSGREVAAFDEVFASGSLREAMNEVDYLVLTLPDTPATRHLVDASVLAALPDRAMLINVGRGATLDDSALIAAMQRQALRKAVLDVFETEPLPPGHPYWSMEKVTVTPHVAAMSRPRDVAAIFRTNLVRYLAGESLLHQINLEQGY